MISKLGKQFLPLLKTISISVFLWVIIIIFVPILIVYKKTIELILKVRHREQYRGLMDGMDSFYLMPNGSMDCLINIVMILKSKEKKDVYSEAGRILQEKVLNQKDSYVNLKSYVQSFGGYPYLLKYDCNNEDFLNLIDVPKNKRFDEDYMKELTAALAKKKLPKNNCLLWDVYVTNTPLEEDRRGENQYYRYPVIVRVHHCIGDGTSLLAFFIQLFGDERSQKYCEELIKKIYRGRNQEKNSNNVIDVVTRHLKATINAVKFWFELIFLSFGRIMETIYMKPNDINALHGKQCGEKFVAWVTEGKPKYIQIVKNIKKRIPNTSFSSVVSTALMASISNYFVKNKLPVPEHIQVLIPLLLDFPRIDPGKPVPLKNNSSGLVIELPLQKNAKNLTDFLQKITVNMQKQARYADVVFDRFFVRYIMGLIPLNLIRNTIFQSQTVLLTNVPGGSQIEVFDGCSIELLVPFAPNFQDIGVTLSILTYDDRFQIGLLADKALLHSQSDTQKIIDDVFTYISLLDIESQKLSN